MSNPSQSVTRFFQAQTRLSANGRIVIPAEIRKAMGIQPGEMLVMEVVDDTLRVESFEKRLARVQDEIIRLAGPGRSLADELIAERREEARREDEEWMRQEAAAKLRKAG
jgi:AbrB family looped-hinge helix DNA binding protein